MTLDEYQKKALSTDSFDNKGAEVMDPAFMSKLLGLVGESGEVAEKFKKIVRDKNGVLDESDKAEITKELGDVLWYTGVLAHYLGAPLEDIAAANLDKLQSRHKRGLIRGRGDNR